MAKLRFPLILAGLDYVNEDKDIFLDSTRLLHDMARASMGDEIQLYAYATQPEGYWQTTFAWTTPLEEMSYVVTIIWKQVGYTLEPEIIKYGATFARPDREGEIWKNSSVTDPIKIGQSEEAIKEGTPEYETIQIAKSLGYERFLKNRFRFPERDTLHLHLKEIADEYLEHFESFMLFVIMGVDFLDKSGKSSTARFRKIALPMVRRFFPQLISNHVVSVQPMKGPTALIYYMRYRYGKKPAWSWSQFKDEAKRLLAKWKDEVVKKLIRWRQCHPGPSWLIRTYSPFDTVQ